ncbi:MAG: hypothetical protein ACK4SZ_13090 [Allosphingosinicella sp.]|uniref:hypothetical protein n=1 Tax=Allosphingosinicella sp. TaxID=2823234 RepID=UPI0039578F28
MFKPLVALAAAASIAAAPSTAFAQSDNRNPFTSPGAEIGVPLFLGVGVFMALLATGVIFDDDEDEPVSP